MKHIYIHCPFCTRRCIYCDFSIAVRRKIPAQRYVNAIVREYEYRRSVGEWDDAALETLYVGGGTPSLLPTEHVSELLRFLFEGEDGEYPEVTVEANPENVTGASARAWAGAGVNRVSLGVQSFDPRVLRWMHRAHLPERAATAAQTLRDEGIESISLDLIAALPAHLEHDFAVDLSQALELEPDHISVYGLTVEPRTALARWIAREAVVPATDEAYARDFLLAHEVLTAAGFEHYEVSNYAREGRRSKHNYAYWDGSRYAGLGPSAHGFDGNERRWNVGPWAQYESLVTESGDATGGRELLNPDQRALERVYLGLRVSEGLKLEEMCGFDPALLANAEENGWAETKVSRWNLTAAGWLRLDEIVAALTTSPGGG
jgi:oxygen-independent coproporphyrinogen-3 oxidase